MPTIHSDKVDSLRIHEFDCKILLLSIYPISLFVESKVSITRFLKILLQSSCKGGGCLGKHSQLETENFWNNVGFCRLINCKYLFCCKVTYEYCYFKAFCMGPSKCSTIKCVCKSSLTNRKKNRDISPNCLEPHPALPPALWDAWIWNLLPPFLI